MKWATGDATWDVYLSRVEIAYSMALGDRLRELRGNRHSTFDGRGVHSYSWQIGYAQAAGELVEGVREDPELLGAYPLDVRRAAEADALAEFADELRGER